MSRERTGVRGDQAEGICGKSRFFRLGRASFCGFLVWGMLSGNVWGLGKGGISAGSSSAQVLEELEGYLSEWKNVRGRFEQVDPEGERAGGTFYLQMPGKLRFEYDPPHPLVVVSDGSWVGIENRAEKETQRYPLEKTPLYLFLNASAGGLEGARVVYVEEVDGWIELALEDKNEEIPGRVILHFTEEGKELAGWTVVDAQNLITQVRIFDREENLEISERAFWINENLEEDHNSRRLR